MPGRWGKHLWSRGILFANFAQFAHGLRDRLREHVNGLARAEGCPIHHLRSRRVRKEDFVRQLMADHPGKTGVICVLSAMEKCASFGAVRDARSGHLRLRCQSARCLHYYVYLNDPDFCLCFIAFPTGVPFTIRVYFNGHHWLARQMDRAGIDYGRDDNCFTRIGDFAAAQALADGFEVKRHLHPKLNR